MVSSGDSPAASFNRVYLTSSWQPIGDFERSCAGGLQITPLRLEASNYLRGVPLLTSKDMT